LFTQLEGTWVHRLVNTPETQQNEADYRIHYKTKGPDETELYRDIMDTKSHEFHDKLRAV
jgi:hypothetical protein